MNQQITEQVDDELQKANDIEDEVRKKIVTDFENMLIEAGAGAGKTTIIIDRMINQLTSTNIDISQMAAITFTNKAADELRGRFQWELLWRSEAEQDEAGRRKLQKAAENIDKINISTIHSFCNTMLMEMPFEAGISLDSRLLEEGEENELIKDFFYDYCDKHSGTLSDINIVNEWLYITFRQMCRKSVSEWCYDRTIKTNGNARRAAILNDAFHCFAEIKAFYLSPKVIKVIKKTVKKEKTCQSMYGSFTPADIDAYGRKAADDDPVISEEGKKCYDIACSGVPIDEKNIEALLKLGVAKSSEGEAKLKLAVGRNDTSMNYNEDMLTLAKAVYKESVSISGIIIKCREDWKLFCYDRCMEFLDTAYHEYVRYKRNSSIMSNDDILVVARDMLKSSDMAIQYFRDKYQYIYIDEFQDTDPVQADIIRLLVGENASQASFTKNRFCLIGDPKQSIYAFRGADIRQYMDMKSMMEADENSTICKMHRNYRSSKEICSWIVKKFTQSAQNSFGFPTLQLPVNSLLNHHFTQPSFERILTTQEDRDANNALSGVYQLVRHEAAKGEIVKADVTKLDAEDIADTIEKLVNGKYICAYSKHKKCYETRPICFSDILILTWNTVNIGKYVEALKKKSIPVLISGNTKLRNVAEVDSFVTLLEYLAKPYDSYNFALVMTKIFGCQITTDMKQYMNSVWNTEEIDKLPALAPHEALLTLNHYLKMDYDTPIQKVEAVVDDMQLWLCRHEYSDKELKFVLGNVEQLMETVRESDYGTLIDIVDTITAAAENLTDREMMIRDENLYGDGGSVRIMNLHKAKGLEGNIVFLANPVIKFRRMNPTVITDADKGYVSVLYCKGTDENYAVSFGGNHEYNSHLDEELRMHMEEEVRLLYVACTRAREVLYITFLESEKGELKDEYVWNRLYTQPKVKDNANEDEAEEEDETKERYTSDTCKEGSNGNNDIVDLDADIASKGFQEINQMSISEEYKEIEKKNTARIEELKIEYGYEINPSLLAVHRGGVLGETEDIHGGMFGTIVHKLFELTVNRIRTEQLSEEQKQIPDKGDLRLAVEAGIKSNPLNAEQCRELKLDESARALNSEELRQLLLQHLEPRLTEIYTKFIKSTLNIKIRKAKNVYTELPFDMTIPAEEAENLKNRLNLKKYQSGQALHVSGVIDLLLEFEDHSRNRFEIWDYKTNAKAAEESIMDFQKRLYETYQYQLEVYEVALRRMIMVNNEGVVEKRIYELVSG